MKKLLLLLALMAGALSAQTTIYTSFGWDFGPVTPGVCSAPASPGFFYNTTIQQVLMCDPRTSRFEINISTGGVSNGITQYGNTTTNLSLYQQTATTGDVVIRTCPALTRCLVPASYFTGVSTTANSSVAGGTFYLEYAPASAPTTFYKFSPEQSPSASGTSTAGFTASVNISNITLSAGDVLAIHVTSFTQTGTGATWSLILTNETDYPAIQGTPFPVFFLGLGATNTYVNTTTRTICAVSSATNPVSTAPSIVIMNNTVATRTTGNLYYIPSGGTTIPALILNPGKTWTSDAVGSTTLATRCLAPGDSISFSWDATDSASIAWTYFD